MWYRFSPTQFHDPSITLPWQNSGAFPIPLLIRFSCVEQKLLLPTQNSPTLHSEWVYPETAFGQLIQQEYVLDQQLGLKRPSIPLATITISEQPHHLDFYRWYYQLTQTSYQLLAIPDTPQQCLYLRAYQQSQSLAATLLANHLSPTLPEDWSSLYQNQIHPTHYGAIEKCLHSHYLRNKIYLCIYHLIQLGFPLIQQWASIHQQPTPFASPHDLFLLLWAEARIQHLLSGSLLPGNRPRYPHHQAREDDRRFRKFLRHESLEESEENLVLASLQKLGWQGYWLIALWEWGISALSDQQPKLQEQLKEGLRHYTKALEAADSLSGEALYWLDGNPQRTRGTNQQPAEIAIDPSGYLYCQHV